MKVRIFIYVMCAFMVGWWGWEKWQEHERQDHNQIYVEIPPGEAGQVLGWSEKEGRYKFDYPSNDLLPARPGIHRPDEIIILPSESPPKTVEVGNDSYRGFLISDVKYELIIPDKRGTDNDEFIGALWERPDGTYYWGKCDR